MNWRHIVLDIPLKFTWSTFRADLRDLLLLPVNAAVLMYGSILRSPLKEEPVTYSLNVYIRDHVVEQLAEIIVKASTIAGDVACDKDDIRKCILGAPYCHLPPDQKPWTQEYSPTEFSPSRRCLATELGCLDVDKVNLTFVSSDKAKSRAETQGSDSKDLDGDGSPSPSKRSRTSGSSSSNSSKLDNCARRWEVRDFKVDGCQSAHVLFRQAYRGSTIKILKASRPKIDKNYPAVEGPSGNENIGADDSPETEKFANDTFDRLGPCAGPTFRLGEAAHTKYDALQFYWAWKMITIDEETCVLLARRDVEAYVPDLEHLPATWRIVLADREQRESFVQALALRKHLTLTWARATMVAKGEWTTTLDVAAFAKDWNSETSSCWTPEAAFAELSETDSAASDSDADE
jgi:hypothetical protein